MCASTRIYYSYGSHVLMRLSLSVQSRRYVFALNIRSGNIMPLSVQSTDGLSATVIVRCWATAAEQIDGNIQVYTRSTVKRCACRV